MTEVERLQHRVAYLEALLRNIVAGDCCVLEAARRAGRVEGYRLAVTDVVDGTVSAYNDN